MRTTRAVGRSATAAGIRVRIRRRVLVVAAPTLEVGIEMVAINGGLSRQSDPAKGGSPRGWDEPWFPQLASRMAAMTLSTKVSAGMFGLFQYCVTASCMAPVKFGVLMSSIASN